ncbi:MFS transporter, partial [Kibdelosporangium lantanae]
VAVATAVRMAEPGREASTVARVTLGLNLGIVLGTPIGTFVGQQFGWRATFAAVSVICAVGLLMVLGFVPEQPHGEPERLGVFAARNVQLAILLTAVGNLGVVMVFTYISPLLTDASGFNAGEDDFHRGGTMYERAFGDPTVAHPNLGPISEPPFFALPVYPGSVGTKGGARTDDQHDRRWRHYRVRTGVGADRRGLTVHYGRTRSGTSLMRQRSWA